MSQDSKLVEILNDYPGYLRLAIKLAILNLALGVPFMAVSLMTGNPELARLGVLIASLYSGIAIMEYLVKALLIFLLDR